MSANVLTVRFSDSKIYERLRDRANSERRSMNRLAEDAIEAFVASEAPTLVPFDEETLAPIIRKIIREDADILKALGEA